MIPSRDLETYSKIGSALWLDPSYSEQSSLETLAAVSLLELSAERTLEKASAALLARAKNVGVTSHTQLNREFLNQHFFRLSAEDRFILVSLHLGKWSYQRLGRIFSKTEDEIQELAWGARLQFSSSMRYPAGPSGSSAQCPSYDSSRPWTQRFLDDEIASGRDRLFLQTHLLACDSCNQALNRWRESYFKIEKELIRIVGQPQNLSSLETALDEGFVHQYRHHLSFLNSLKIFSRRWDIRLVFCFLVALFFYKISHT
jgi:hypothetical protein